MTSSTSSASKVLSSLKERSSKRKQLLADTIGASSTQDLTALLRSRKAVQSSCGSTSEVCAALPPASTSDCQQLTQGEDLRSSVVSEGGSSSKDAATKKSRTEEDADSSGDERVTVDDYYKVLKEEEEVYKGSASFLKGTQSANPHNDYCQHYVDSGQRPQNFIRDPPYYDRYSEHPKLKELITLKDKLIAETAPKPMYLKADLSQFNLRDLNSRFDVILIEPPLAEYQQKASLMGAQDVWTWDMIEELDVQSVADTRAFVWLWCGSSPEGTRRGRQCLRRWGFRRCEDICWVKRNTANPGKREVLDRDQLFQRTKEHCLMGIKGTVRRSVDGDFIHANVDIDLIISEEPTGGEMRAKPEEIFLIAEHFCLGRRRLHLFGRDDTVRAGWVTAGPELTTSNFNSKEYKAFLERENGPGYTTGCTERIEILRPKSPDRGGKGGGPGVSGGNRPMNLRRPLDKGIRRTESMRFSLGRQVERCSSAAELHRRARSGGGAAEEAKKLLDYRRVSVSRGKITVTNRLRGTAFVRRPRHQQLAQNRDGPHQNIRAKLAAGAASKWKTNQRKLANKVTTDDRRRRTWKQPVK